MPKHWTNAEEGFKRENFPTDLIKSTLFPLKKLENHPEIEGTRVKKSEENK